MDTSAINPSQPRLRGAKVPSGHVMVNIKHRNGDIVKSLQGFGVRVLFDDSLGMVDFFPSSRSAVIWMREADLICGMPQERIEKIKRSNYTVTVLAEVTEVSTQYFKKLQKSGNLEHGICIFPVHSIEDVAKFLSCNVCSENSANPLLQSVKKLPLENDVVSFLKTCPGIGEKKVIEILLKFGSLENLCSCSQMDLEAIVGKSVAAALQKFLHGSID